MATANHPMSFATSAAVSGEAKTAIDDTRGSSSVAGCSALTARVCPCLMCSESFNVAEESGKQFFLRHLLVAHHVVIGEVEEVLDLPTYCTYWHERLRSIHVTEVMAAIRTNTKPPPPSTPAKFVPPQETYYLLNKVLPEDAQLRQELAVNTALKVQESERADVTTNRSCLFCSKEFTGNRSLVLQHMLEAHSFSLGKPDNLVFVDEFLALLRKKLDDFICLYCERTYRDRPTLKDHVRKKHHRKLNPQNTDYDRFFMINYANSSRQSWQESKSAARACKDEEEDDDDNDDVDDRSLASSEGVVGSLPSMGVSPGSLSFQSEPVLPSVLCLFCLHYSLDITELNQHTLREHSFDLVATLSSVGFYWRMRLVNFVRHRVNERTCIYCAEKCSSRERLLEHMSAAKHFQMPARELWSDVHYLFPTDENDALLQQLAEMDDSDREDDDQDVAVPEDLQRPDDEVIALAKEVREGL